MTAHGEQADDAEELRKRARILHGCADDAHGIVARLGGFLGGEARRAGSDDVWKGPFADHSHGQLDGYRKKLEHVAGALQHDARRWRAEAQRLEEQAKHAAHKGK